MADELTGTASETEAAAQAETSPETTPVQESATPGAAEAQPTQEESFLSDADLLNQIRQDPRLNKFYGKMQTAYGKSREELKAGREAASQIREFYQNPAYRRQVLQQFANELGQTSTATKPGAQAPATLVEKIKSSLAPELQWMAPSLADANWTVMQETIAPLQQQQAQREQQSLESAYDGAATALSQKFPGWEESEDEMGTVYDWLVDKQSNYTHPKYGNKLEALYKLTQMITGNTGLMRAEALRATSEASRARTVTGQAGRPAQENTTEKIRVARTPREAFALAAKAAEDEMRKSGTLPE